MPHLERLVRADADGRASGISPDVDAALGTILRRARHRRRLRTLRVSTVAVTVVVVGSIVGPRMWTFERGIDRHQRVASTPSPQMGPTSPRLAVGEFGRVVHPGLAVVRANGLVGRWTIGFDDQGGGSLLAPSDFTGPRSWRLEVAGNVLTTSAFEERLCRGRSRGTYRWTQVAGFLILDWISDDCEARAWLLTSRPWRGRP
jgi:hypothetical protein